MAEKDPNIANEDGHTFYPKVIDHPTETVEVDAKLNPTLAGKSIPKKVVVNNKSEEDELLSGNKSEGKKPKGWDK